jgi:hypothetical protein
MNFPYFILCGLWFAVFNLGLLTSALAVQPGNCAVWERPKIVVSTTPERESCAPICQQSFQVADERGTVCRNGAYACNDAGSGIIGYSCCGCGFCGWWSAN